MLPDFSDYLHLKPSDVIVQRNFWNKWLRPVTSFTELLQQEVKDSAMKKEIKYCRSCYDHLAGFAGVAFTEALEKNRYIKRSGQGYSVSERGWEWLNNLDISAADFTKNQRPLTRQCLDCSEKRPHLAGQLGAAILKNMLHQKWLIRPEDTRQLLITPKGRKQLHDLLGVKL